MSDGADGDAFTQALADINSRKRKSRIAGALALWRSDHPDADAVLMQLFQDTKDDYSIKVVVSRILAERDPDRDPSYFLDAGFPSGDPGKLPSSDRLGRYLEDMRLVTSPAGFSRLRRLKPVDTFAELLGKDKRGSVRTGATRMLGDTADLAALDPLCTALRDPDWGARMDAADAVRRLRHSGAATILDKHPILEILGRLLSDEVRYVRIAAARALVLTGGRTIVEAHRTTAPKRDRRSLDKILRGGIPPLNKIWIGDENT